MNDSPRFIRAGSWGSSRKTSSSFLAAQPQRGLLKDLNSHTSDIVSLFATPQFLFSGSLDGTIGMWDLPSCSFRKFLTSHKGKIIGKYMIAILVGIKLFFFFYYQQ